MSLYCVKGNNTDLINRTELENITSNFNKIIVDLGTGDGRFVYKNAKANPDNFYIGIDPSEKLLQEYSKKSNKDKLNNTLFIRASIEMLPGELKGVANKLHINFPWGSLLGGIINTKEKIIKNMLFMLSKLAEVIIIFGYSPSAEPTETDRLNLEKINRGVIEKKIIPEFESKGLELVEIKKLKKDDLGNIESTWGKKLEFGQDRPVFKVILKKENQS